LAAVAALACSPGDAGDGADAAALGERPNILFVVWDTVRADHMSLYGYERATTPALDAWAKGALVFDDVVSAAPYTVPSHASMFTGLAPSDHCANSQQTQLDARFTTLAELLRASGYATFLYSENPHVSEKSGFAQGFDAALHPWSDAYAERALAIVSAKVEGDASSELAARLASTRRGEAALTAWNVKAAGELAQEALLAFLDARTDRDAPWFAFVNYMEAHRPTIPPRRFRERFLDPASVDASYRVDRSWDTLWRYTFRRRELGAREIELTRATYDAALLELDELFANLLRALERGGHLRDTVVVLTADHGEHLGEHHMLDHQSTMYEPVLRVPLVLHHPARIGAGRRSDPAMNADLFPTLLALAKASPPDGLATSARDLLADGAATADGAAPRARLAEETAEESTGVVAMRRLDPAWDATPWLRSQRALYLGRYKWIESSNGERELYDVEADPQESRDLAELRAIDAARMRDALATATRGLGACADRPPLELDPDERALLESLGYAQPGATDASEPAP
ncbi:MAG: sulfatase, partial [Myxococcales bacterium]|nr:sulfatase [Myxococcales bacterium]